jgi:hypothetical protein
MIRKVWLSMFFVVLLTAVGLCGCSGATSPQSGLPEATQPALNTNPPVSTPMQEGGSQSSADLSVPCSQLIPEDEIKNLLMVESVELKEMSSPGSTFCQWKYTPKDGMNSRYFDLQVGYSDESVSTWESIRKSELSNEPSYLVVISMDGLGDENYLWTSANTGMKVVYVRQGNRTLIFRYLPQDVLFMGTESGIMDMSQRVFARIS